MQITITWQTLITAFGVVGAVVGLVTYFVKLVLWVNKQDQQDKAIAKLEAHHEEDMDAIKGELTLLIFGVQACLKGLIEQGCDGPVTDAANQFEKYLNKKAHS
jgi:hypothetical protein